MYFFKSDDRERRTKTRSVVVDCGYFMWGRPHKPFNLCRRSLSQQDFSRKSSPLRDAKVEDDFCISVEHDSSWRRLFVCVRQCCNNDVGVNARCKHTTTTTVYRHYSSDYTDSLSPVSQHSPPSTRTSMVGNFFFSSIVKNFVCGHISSSL